eukprot:1141108_1
MTCLKSKLNKQHTQSIICFFLFYITSIVATKHPSKYRANYDLGFGVAEDYGVEDHNGLIDRREIWFDSSIFDLAASSTSLPISPLTFTDVRQSTKPTISLGQQTAFKTQNLVDESDEKRPISYAKSHKFKDNDRILIARPKHQHNRYRDYATQNTTALPRTIHTVTSRPITKKQFQSTRSPFVKSKQSLMSPTAFFLTGGGAIFDRITYHKGAGTPLTEVESFITVNHIQVVSMQQKMRRKLDIRIGKEQVWQFPVKIKDKSNQLNDKIDRFLFKAERKIVAQVTTQSTANTLLCRIIVDSLLFIEDIFCELVKTETEAVRDLRPFWDLVESDAKSHEFRGNDRILITHFKATKHRHNECRDYATQNATALPRTIDTVTSNPTAFFQTGGGAIFDRITYHKGAGTPLTAGIANHLQFVSMQQRMRRKLDIRIGKEQVWQFPVKIKDKSNQLNDKIDRFLFKAERKIVAQVTTQSTANTLLCRIIVDSLLFIEDIFCELVKTETEEVRHLRPFWDLVESDAKSHEFRGNDRILITHFKATKHRHNECRDYATQNATALPRTIDTVTSNPTAFFQTGGGAIFDRITYHKGAGTPL